jgi:DNA-directed RNA polymerase subunit RPC12/RpoP
MRVAQVTIHLLVTTTYETSTKSEEFSEYSKGRPVPCMCAFHILVKANKTAVDWVKFLLTMW